MAMRMRLLLSMALILAPAAHARAQSAAELFDDAAVHEVRLRMNSRDLALLRERFMLNTYYAADFTWQGTRVRNVAVRSRGFGSRNPGKPGLLVDFDRYVGGRTFAGQKSLVLDNLWQDPSLLREKLSMAMFARMGIPAPRIAFARLYINDVYHGLYSLAEAIEEPMLRRTVGEDTGQLFEYHWVREFRGTYLGDDLEQYKPLFEPRTREKEADTLVYGPLAEMFRQINQPLDGAWRERAEAYLDLTAVIRQAAVENFIAENDGLAGYAGMNNFYLYRRASDNQHRTLPWDKDNAFLLSEFPVFQRLEENVIFQRAMAFDDLWNLYYDTILEASASASADGWLESEIDRLSAMIREAAAADTRKQFSTEAFEEGVEFLRDFARRRGAFVAAQIAELRAGR